MWKIVPCFLMTLLIAGCFDDGGHEAYDESDGIGPEDMSAAGEGTGSGGDDEGAGDATGSGGFAYRPDPALTAGDSDRDGVQDDHERSLAASCMVLDVDCASLGIEPPTVGARDYVLVQFGRDGRDQDWRLPPDVWDAFLDEVRPHGWSVQVADLGLRDDMDVEATWDDRANEGAYWFTWVTYSAASEDTAGTNLYNWIDMHHETDANELTQTLLHEVYHSVLGDLRGRHSQCEDEEIGGKGHSNDAASILYVPADCDTEEVDALQLGEAERAELAVDPFENLRLMNRADWFEG